MKKKFDKSRIAKNIAKKFGADRVKINSLPSGEVLSEYKKPEKIGILTVAKRIKNEDRKKIRQLDEEEHIIRHKTLHRELDELVADFISDTKKLPSKTSIMELMKWSHKQTKGK